MKLHAPFFISARNAATLERASALSREMANPAEAIRLASATEAFFSK